MVTAEKEMVTLFESNKAHKYLHLKDPQNCFVFLLFKLPSSNPKRFNYEKLEGPFVPLSSTFTLCFYNWAFFVFFSIHFLFSLWSVSSIVIIIRLHYSMINSSLKHRQPALNLPTNRRSGAGATHNISHSIFLTTTSLSAVMVGGNC